MYDGRPTRLAKLNNSDYNRYPSGPQPEHLSLLRFGRMPQTASAADFSQHPYPVRDARC